jgi:RNA polymerase sigma-70 factor, ECF subfamily
MMNSEIVWQKFSGKLMNFLLKRVSNETIADDLLQEIFIKIHLKLPQLKDEAKLEYWVFQIAYNQLNDYYKANKNNKEVALKEEDWASEDAKKLHFETCLLPFIDSLPSIYKESIILSDLEGQKIKNIALSLKLSESGVKSRIQRGREMIKQHFIDCCNMYVDSNGKLKGEHTHSHESWDCKDDSCLVHKCDDTSE